MSASLEHTPSPTLDEDTIVALATASGRSALATVRVSGKRAAEICRAVLDPWPTEARKATLSVVRDPESGTVVDQVIAVVYDAPRSYTGESMVELTGHGGPLSPAAIIATLTRRGARQARPGEFTQRAVLNGKLDLLQAESIADVVDARTEAMRRAALFQLDGGLSARIAALRDRLLDLEGLLAYEIDFPEEDDGPIPASRIEESANQLLAQMKTLLATARVGEAVRDGAVVVIAGRPNVGKSSLFNALLGYRRAIVTDIPGTTRDALEAVIETGRWPLRLVDTAGLRDSDDVVEREGLEIGRRYLSGAQLALVCDDDPQHLSATAAAVRASSAAPIVAVRTKSDLDPSAAHGTAFVPDADAVVSTSVVTGEGLADVLEATQRALDRHLGQLADDTAILTRARHRAALEQACSELTEFEGAWRTSSVPATVAALHVRTAAHALEELVGVVDVDEVLARVFSTFCVGK